MNEAHTILALDADSESLALLMRILVPAGYRMVSAGPGTPAPSAASVDPPDLILLDMGKGWLETCRRLKEDPSTRLVPVIMMCAGAGVEELTAGLRAGAVDYVNKPFQAVELLARIGCRLESERSAAARTEELRQAKLRLEALWSLSTLADFDDQAVNDFVLEQIVRMTGSRYGFFGLMNEAETVMTIHSWSGEAMKDCSMPDRQSEYRIADVGIWGEAVRHRKPLFVNDYSAPHEAKKGFPAGHVPMSRLMVIPDFSAGRIVSVVAVANKATDYDTTDLKQVTVFMQGVRTVSERRQAWDALRKSEIKYHSVADFTWDLETWRAPDGRFVYVSPSCERITGYTVDEFMADPGLSLAIAVPEDRELLAAHYALEGAGDEGDDRHLDFRFITKDGRMRWISHYCRSIVDPEGRPLGRRASNRDITDRKQAEEKVEALLKEKELLLREVHHRIKNNMISVASLLSMQAAKVRDPQAVEALTDAQRRLKSMGVLYDKLYRSDNLREMPVRVYLEPLLSEIVATFPSAAPVSIEADLDDFVLRAKTLLPLGIIVNEIVTNSLKYAFPDGHPGKISAVASRKGSLATIVIGDDGVGLPESVDPGNSGGLGLALVSGLMEQIGGTVRIERGLGTRFILEFEISPE